MGKNQFDWLVVMMSLIVGHLLSCTSRTSVGSVSENSVERLEVIDNGTWCEIADGEDIGSYLRIGDTIYGCKAFPFEYYHHFPHMKEVDVNSFRVCIGSEYARDSLNVYYPIDVCFVDGYDGGGCYMTKYVVDGADPKTFKYIGNGYGADKRYMYRDGERIPWDNEVIRSNGLRTSADNRNLIDTVEVPVEMGRND